MTLSEWCAQEVGRQLQLAAFLRVKPPNVARWLSGGREVPLRHAPYIQTFTGNAVTCEELLPSMADFFALVRTLKAREQATRGLGDAV